MKNVSLTSACTGRKISLCSRERVFGIWILETLIKVKYVQVSNQSSLGTLFESRASVSSFYLANVLKRNIPQHIKDSEASSVAVYKKCINEWLFSIGRKADEELIRSLTRQRTR